MAESQLSPIGRFEKILLSSDGSEFSKGAESVAMALAARVQAHLHVMRMVLSNPEYDVLAPDVLARHEQEAYASIFQLCALAKKPGGAAECTPLVMHGMHPHEEILEAAESTQADLIVMGRRGGRGLARLMVGDATARVVAQARCKVLVVPRNAGMWSKGILLATDGSRYSDQAAVNALKLAKAFDLPLIVTTICAATHDAALCQEAEQIVTRVLEHARQEGVQATPCIVEGEPAQAIVDAAQKKGADLIVGGSHGRTGMGKVFLGSVMERVIGLAPCPVLTVK